MDRGFKVRALVRNPGKASHLAALGVILIEGDLANNAALERLLEGCDAVVHGAGAVRGNSQADFDQVNVAGTAAVLNAISAQARRPRLLLLSSISHWPCKVQQYTPGNSSKMPDAPKNKLQPSQDSLVTYKSDGKLDLTNQLMY